MTDTLKEIETPDDDEEYQLRPYGLLLMRLGSEELAQRACDAIELYLRRHKRAVIVDDNGLHFERAADDLDFAIINRAIMWRDFTDSQFKQDAAVKLEEAVDAARHQTWAERRGDKNEQ